MQWKAVHEKALAASRQFKQSESALLAALKEADTHRVFERFGLTSTYSYCLKVLKLSEDQAYAFIRVARLSREMPALQAAVETGRVNVSTLRKLAPVITPQNQAEWLAKAESLPRKVLEQEVARVAPQGSSPDRLKPLSADNTGLTCTLDRETAELLRRAQEILGQKKARHLGLGETIKAVLQDWQKKQDPLVKAQRVLAKAKPEPVKRSEVASEPSVSSQEKKRIALPAKLEHAVHLRDRGQCSFEHLRFGRCESRLWLQVHHRLPVSRGGQNTLKNLQTLCTAHHRMQHKKHPSQT